MALLFYTDPGSGMMLLQILFAFFTGVLFYFRKFFYRLFGKSGSGGANSSGGKNASERAPDDKNEV